MQIRGLGDSRIRRFVDSEIQEFGDWEIGRFECFFGVRFRELEDFSLCFFFECVFQVI